MGKILNVIGYLIIGVMFVISCVTIVAMMWFLCTIFGWLIPRVLIALMIFWLIGRVIVKVLTR